MWLRNSPDSAPWMTRWSYVLVIVMTGLRPRRDTSLGSMPAYSGGKPIEPTATITLWPGMRRGMLSWVPPPPGFVSVAVVPAKSSSCSEPSRARLTMSL